MWVLEEPPAPAAICKVPYKLDLCSGIEMPNSIQLLADEVIE